MSFSEEQLQGMASRLFDACPSTPDGRTAIHVVQLADLVRENLGMVAAVFPTMVGLLVEHRIPRWGCLSVIAKLYRLFAQDDSLEIHLRAAARRAGVPIPDIEIPKTMGSPGSVSPPTVETMSFHYSVSAEELIAGDLSGLRREFSDAVAPAPMRTALRKRLGHCTLGFRVPGDAREAWEIPEVRRFVATLHAELPFFTMFLDAEKGAHFLHLACLCDPDCIKRLDAAYRLECRGGCLDIVRVIVRAIAAVCRRHALPFAPYLDPLLHSLPPDVRARFTEEL